MDALKLAELVCVYILVRIRKPDAGSGGAYAAPLSVDWPGRVSQTDTSTGIVLDLHFRRKPRTNDFKRIERFIAPQHTHRGMASPSPPRTFPLSQSRPLPAPPLAPAESYNLFVH